MLGLYKGYRVKHCLSQKNKGELPIVTNEEFNRQLQVINDRRSKLIAERDAVQTKIEIVSKDETELRQKLINSQGFQVGTKVRFDGVQYLIFTAEVWGTRKNPRICYRLTKAKKDGSLPKNCLDGKWGINHSDLVEGWE